MKRTFKNTTSANDGLSYQRLVFLRGIIRKEAGHDDVADCDPWLNFQSSYDTQRTRNHASRQYELPNAEYREMNCSLS